MRLFVLARVEPSVSCCIRPAAAWPRWRRILEAFQARAGDSRDRDLDFFCRRDAPVRNCPSSSELFPLSAAPETVFCRGVQSLPSPYFFSIASRRMARMIAHRFAFRASFSEPPKNGAKWFSPLRERKILFPNAPREGPP